MDVVGSKRPTFMVQLLEELGLNEGTRIPLANQQNQDLESILINRQNEIQQLKESLSAHKTKRADLDNYKNYVHTEYQENTRLLFAHKQQLEQEVKLRQLSSNEADILERDILSCNKQTSNIADRLDRVQNSIADLLKKADSLKGEVCGEKGILQEWRTALESSAKDISSIEQFTKQDLSKAKALETKRQKLKLEHDQMQERLHQLISNLSAEERACERISVQVADGMEQRKQMMSMWTAAVDNLRQRDNEIRHVREDYTELEQEAARLSEQCREQQAFLEQQRGHSAAGAADGAALAARLAGARADARDLQAHNVTLDGEIQSLQREISNMRLTIEKLSMENRQIMDTQHKKDIVMENMTTKINELKAKLEDSTDKTRSSDKRAKELEDILNDEENYARQLTVNQQRAQHCSFLEQQKLTALKNDDKLFHMQMKASKAMMSKLDTKQYSIENYLQIQKEALYNICYQVETIGARVIRMEGIQVEKECSVELIARENRLKEVLSRHAARVSLLERHSGKLHDDLRRLTRDLEAKGAEHSRMKSRLKTSVLEAEGGDKECRALRAEWRRARVDEALLRLRVEQAARALANIDRATHARDTRQLQIEAAMSSRLVEISARREMFAVQRRALIDDCGRLRADIRERDQRIRQLVKRHDILIAALGKDDAGQQLSATFFKIKFAAERAELRERGAALDAESARLERDIRALEYSLRLLHAAHERFMSRLAPLDELAPEIQELDNLTRQYYASRDELKQKVARIAALEDAVSELNTQLVLTGDKYKQLTAKEAECENDLETSREKCERQASRLQHANDLVRQYARRARRLFDGEDDLRIFQMSVWVRDYWEAWQSGIRALGAACAAHPSAYSRAAQLLAAPDVGNKRLQALVQRFRSDASALSAKESLPELDKSLFSSSSESSRGSSIKSGYSTRLKAFRKTLAPKLQEKAGRDHQFHCVL
ncbi:coiled-coil domain-containing protein 39-like isoform X2 [Aricia agestis]|uniref:coiled-coil domain-containing protein 39-like isoform X2 n=1 Tax=Aricia agestis TaxID=91739 RepID=UPI001C202F2C|nr:coiled-coil domain-containing protein 39-like isoform X2 [Aricia agestis]